MEDKVKKQYVGNALGTKLSKDLQEAHERLERIRGKEQELDTWHKVKKVLDDTGVLPWGWYHSDSWIQELEQKLKGKCDPYYLERAIKDARNILTTLEGMQVKEDTDD